MNSKLANGEIYHIFNKSIANFKIFSESTTQRFLNILDYYNDIEPKRSFSHHIIINNSYELDNLLLPKRSGIVKFICYCIMPDHYHLLVKVLNKDLIYQYINNYGNAYTRYFNTKLGRKGPLWQSGYNSVKVESNEQLLHVSRYIHLNPTTTGLVDKPEDWPYSSYKDYIGNSKFLDIMKEVSIKSPLTYKKFCEDNIDYQRKLKQIKKLLLE